MKFTIMTLADNSIPLGSSGLIGEHGQSFYVEAGGIKLLCDTGQGLVLLNNAAELGIDLQAIETVFLSHGHDDHSGGLKPLVQTVSGFRLVAHPDVFGEKLVKKDGQFISRSIPMDASGLARHNVRLELNSEPFMLAPGTFSTGEIPLETEFERIEPIFFTKADGEIVPDLLPDDQALFLDTQSGLVVLLGCTHRGLINTLTHIRGMTGKRICAMFGGLHLWNAPDEKIQILISELREFDIHKIGVGHCTGMRAIKALSDEFGDRVVGNGVGMSFQF